MPIQRLSGILTNVLGIITGIEGFGSHLLLVRAVMLSSTKKKRKFRHVTAQPSVGPLASPKVHVSYASTYVYIIGIVHCYYRLWLPLRLVTLEITL